MRQCLPTAMSKTLKLSMPQGLTGPDQHRLIKLLQVQLPPGVASDLKRSTKHQQVSVWANDASPASFLPSHPHDHGLSSLCASLCAPCLPPCPYPALCPCLGALVSPCAAPCACHPCPCAAAVLSPYPLRHRLPCSNTDRLKHQQNCASLRLSLSAAPVLATRQESAHHTVGAHCSSLATSTYLQRGAVWTP